MLRRPSLTNTFNGVLKGFLSLKYEQCQSPPPVTCMPTGRPPIASVSSFRTKEPLVVRLAESKLWWRRQQTSAGSPVEKQGYSRTTESSRSNESSMQGPARPLYQLSQKNCSSSKGSLAMDHGKYLPAARKSWRCWEGPSVLKNTGLSPSLVTSEIRMYADHIWQTLCLPFHFPPRHRSAALCTAGSVACSSSCARASSDLEAARTRSSWPSISFLLDDDSQSAAPSE